MERTQGLVIHGDRKEQKRITLHGGDRGKGVDKALEEGVHKGRTLEKGGYVYNRHNQMYKRETKEQRGD